ncbi:transporter [Insulibacter thermoxylanivorax]|uniref:Transporter n=1 Tax=Insulibacter thermoxylanivorax TaxID=2749268 RepID=A0A916QD66_9BACL|nr:ATP-binding protein [Insulibacter thermoxylanivorax]GFR37198.1 transporter [Insulibacter thermoxylanivorax]
MLVAFSCKNFGSFRDQVVLSMEATNKDEYIDFNSFEYHGKRILKSALLFGPNGSGKTNLFKALKYMQRMVTSSVIDDEISERNDYFRFSQDGDSIPSSFEIVIQDEDITWTYGFEILNGKVIHEWLDKKKHRRTKVFERTGPNWESITLHGAWKKHEDLRERTRENALFLTLSAMFNVTEALRIFHWFADLMIILDEDISPGYTINLMREDEQYKNLVLLFLQNADFGIDDFEYEIQDLEISDAEKKRLLKNSRIPLKTAATEIRLNVRKQVVDVKTLHKVYDSEDRVVGTVSLPFLVYQSSGTIKLFELIGPIIKTLMEGGVLIIDEIDSKLHPLIVRHILNLFHSLDANKGNGQLICNTHNVLLLEEDVRRDQIWFMQKDETGASELYSLAEFKNVRKNDPLLKKYLLGVYGAVPFKDVIKKV